jgi:hypothetical protein
VALLIPLTGCTSLCVARLLSNLAIPGLQPATTAAVGHSAHVRVAAANLSVKLAMLWAAALPICKWAIYSRSGAFSSVAESLVSADALVFISCSAASIILFVLGCQDFMKVEFALIFDELEQNQLTTGDESAEYLSQQGRQASRTRAASRHDLVTPEEAMRFLELREADNMRRDGHDRDQDTGRRDKRGTSGTGNRDFLQESFADLEVDEYEHDLHVASEQEIREANRSWSRLKSQDDILRELSKPVSKLVRVM